MQYLITAQRITEVRYLVEANSEDEAAGIYPDEGQEIGSTDVSEYYESTREASQADLEDAARARLEYLRSEIRAERISYGELAELQNLAPYIESGDTELLEPAGVPEYPQEED